jgi:hypothetical protein
MYHYNYKTQNSELGALVQGNFENPYREDLTYARILASRCVRRN